MDAFDKIAKLKWLPTRYWFYLRDAMRSRLTITDPKDGSRYKFVADSLHSYQRGAEFLSKEPQTIDWLRKNLRPTDAFLDIGANVGTFSMFAAKHLSADGRVYACEPHLPTTVQLLQNVAANALDDRVAVISVAAAGEDGFLPFKYKRWRQGASGSQLAVDGGPAMKRHVGTELKLGMRVDTMIAQGVIRPPNLIKIDTDGLEIPIVAGMQGLLRGPNRPRSLLVEVQPGELKQQTEQMKKWGYRLVDTHLLGKWIGLHKQGRPLDQLGLNTVFEPVT